MSRVLVTGAAGMLGQAVVARARALGLDVVACTRAGLDITDPSAARRVLAETEPAAVVNCAAWTDVDGAESAESDALAVNGLGAGRIAAAAAEVGARIVHVSTDYVFDGDRARACGGTGGPWIESDPTGPISAYGRTKLAGELAVAESNPEHAIVRTAWVFGAGGRNFVDTMLGLAADRDEVSVVTDQVGCPTWTGHLASALVELAERTGDVGLFHVAGAGECSWYEFAIEIFDRAGVSCRVLPTTSDRFPRPAPRPAWSVLGTEREPPIVLPPWQDGLQGHLATRGG